jgi:hypothetical protein
VTLALVEAISYGGTMPDGSSPLAALPPSWQTGAWGAFMLFLIPVGGGIPAGVLLARAHGVSPLVMAGLYFLSDVVMAFVVEPVLAVLFAVGRWIPALGRLGRRIAGFMQGNALRGGGARGPLALVLISFGVDPITGRAAAAAAGHGFVPGWALAIAGDMLYFGMIMASTLWLQGMLGNETLTMAVMLLIMLFLPSLVRRWQERSRPVSASG